MKKISEMYRLSGGTDYRHTCFECPNCQRDGKQQVCRLYREAGGRGGWKSHFIACKFFGLPHLPGNIKARLRQQDTEEEGWEQMDIFVFVEGK